MNRIADALADTMTPSPADIEAGAAEKILGFWTGLGLCPSYPTSTQVVLRLLRNADYAIDIHVLDDFIRRRYIDAPPRRAGGYQWSAFAIYALTAALEYRRRWVPFSPIHAAKMTAFERMLHFLRTD